MYIVIGAIAASVLMVGTATAAQISAGSELSINGEDHFTNSSVTFVGLGNVGGTAGDFSVLPNCNDCVSFSQVLTPASTGLLWTVADAGQASTFSINNVASFTPDGTAALPNLTVLANGTLTLTNKDATPGQMELTTQGPEGTVNVTFSATAIPTPAGVPEPASMAILGTSLLSLAVAYRRRR